MKKKAVIINCFDTYENRVFHVEQVLEQYYDVSIIQSDFRHYLKEVRTTNKQNITLIQSKKYSKNLSLKRLYSHHHFSKKALQFIENTEVDLIYVLLPPNSLAKYVSKYKKRFPKVKVIMDIIDLWPETLPIKNLEKFFTMKPWMNLRDKHLKYSDLVITECNLFEEKLDLKAKKIKTKTLYMTKSDIDINSNLNLDTKKMGLVYLGSINNIIDIVKITEIVSSINANIPVDFHIIGDGERRQELINKTSNAGANVIYHGNIYDENKKQSIFDKCHFGLNIMKDSVVVGLTMKSIDYFQHGIPIINNIKHDTEYLVEEYNLGININHNVDTKNILSFYNKFENNEKVRRNVIQVYDSIFSEEVFQKNMLNILKDL